MSKKKDIWQIAQDLASEEASKSKGDTTLLFAGSKQGGKSSIIYRFTDRNDTPKTTLALEYSFARKANASEVGKSVCNIWELGGGSLFTNLMDFVILPQNILTTSLVLVIDLSVPEELIITIETLLGAVKDRISFLFSESAEWNKVITENAMQRIAESHSDRSKLDPFPIPLLIIGCKYDLFQDFDPEKKKLIAKYLRLVCHENVGQLIFTNINSEAMVNKVRLVLNHLSFETQSSLTTVLDYNKPIFVPFGGDSFQSIGSDSLESLKRMFTSIFPQSVTKLIIPDDPAKDINFKERDVDIKRAQKDSELEGYKRQAELQQHNKRIK